MYKGVTCAALAAMLFGGHAVAQEAATAGATATTTSTATGSESTTGSATGAGAGEVAQKDKMFVQKAAVGGLYEVQSSELADSKAQNDEVKQFAQRMVTDHTAANNELKSIAQSKGIQVPAQLDERHQKMMERLQKQNGEEFDKVYARQQMRAHNEAVQLFTKGAEECQDPELKAFATKTLPKLKEHQQMARSLPGADEAKDPDKTAQKEADQ